MALVRAITSFVAPGRRIVRVGALLDDTDPVVVARPGLFAEVTATSKPATPAPKKRAAPKAAAAPED